MEERDDFSAPCRVRRLVVRGARHTKEHVVRQQLAPLESARTLGEIGDACLSAAASLRELDIFDSADVLCDAAPGAGADADGVPLADIVVTVAEKKRLTSASTGVSTQGGEGSLDASVSLRNLLGRAERFDLNMETGQQKSNTFRLSVLRPRWMGRDAELRAELSKQNVSHLKHSSHIEKIRGGTLGCRLGSPAGPLGSHDVSYALQLRDVCKLPRQSASWPILQQRGPSLKSSLTHTCTYSRLDSPLMPTSGFFGRLVTELAGAPLPIGDAAFTKHTFAASAYLPLLPSGKLSAGLSLGGGLLLPHGAGESSICDRFFLGGANSLWGFRTRGVGPREPRHTPTGEVGPKTPRDALGGDVMATATASVSAALPGKLAEYGVRAHVFGSAGGLQSLARLNAAGSFAPSIRTCAGFGLALPLSIGRVEVNYTHAIRRRPEDAVVRNGLQIGVSAGLG